MFADTFSTSISEARLWASLLLRPFEHVMILSRPLRLAYSDYINM